MRRNRFSRIDILVELIGFVQVVVCSLALICECFHLCDCCLSFLRIFVCGPLSFAIDHLLCVCVKLLHIVDDFSGGLCHLVEVIGSIPSLPQHIGCCEILNCTQTRLQIF